MSQENKSRSFFVIAKKESPDLITSILEAGPDGGEDAVVVFTQHGAAETYLNQAGWMESDTVAELGPADFLAWLLKLRDTGPMLIAINPHRIEQEDGMRQTVIPVAGLIERLGPAIEECLTTTEFSNTRQETGERCS